MRLSLPSCSPFLAAIGLATALSLTSLSAVSAVHDHEHTPLPAAAAVAAQDRQQATDHTQALMALQKQWAKTKGADKSRALERLIAKAEERQAFLAELVKTHPAEVLRVAIPDDQQLGMPAEVLDFLEMRLELEGELESIYEDYPDGSHRKLQFLKTSAGERFNLHLTDETHHLINGTKLKVSGLFVPDITEGSTDGHIVVGTEEGALILATGGENATVAEGSPMQPYALGEQKVLVMLVNFQDKPEQPYTKAYAEDMVFNQVSNYFQENSFNQTWLTGDVVDWNTIPVSSTVCDSTIATEAKAAAEAAGFDLSAYNRYMYVFPQNDACPFAGSASAGGAVSGAWINESLVFTTTSHELGHNLGMVHSHSLVCDDGTSIGSGSATVGSYPWPNCSNLEYGDGLDVMGWADAAHVNAYQKQLLGWLNFNSVGELITVSQSGLYQLLPYSAQTTGTKAIRIAKAVSSTGKTTWYYLEYRQPVGFDASLNNSMMETGNVFQGVTVHAVYDGAAGNGDYLLDMTPETYDLYSRDPALEAGSTFIDPDGSVSITVESVDANGATVYIEVGNSAECIPANPVLSVTPGESQWVEPGSPVTYDVTVTNQDSAGCGTSSFAISESIPSGWTSNLGSSSLALAPGASGSTTLTVISSNSATDGFYDVKVSAINGSDSSQQIVQYVISGSGTATNNAPVAESDSAQLSSTNNSLVIDALANDWDPDNDPIHIQSVGSAAKGNVKLNADGTLSYTPARNFKSTDSFSYTITDGTTTASGSVLVQLQSSGGDAGGNGKGKNH